MQNGRMVWEVNIHATVRCMVLRRRARPHRHWPSQCYSHRDRSCCIRPVHPHQTRFCQYSDQRTCCGVGSEDRYTVSGADRLWLVRIVRVITDMQHRMHSEPAPMPSGPPLLFCKIAPAGGLGEMKDLKPYTGRPYGLIGVAGGRLEKPMLIVPAHVRGEFVPKFQAPESHHLFQTARSLPERPSRMVPPTNLPPLYIWRRSRRISVENMR